MTVYIVHLIKDLQNLIVFNELNELLGQLRYIIESVESKRQW